MSQRVLLFVGLGLMAGGLLVGDVGLMAGRDSSAAVEYRQRPGALGHEHGPDGAFLRHRLGLGPAGKPGEGTWSGIPGIVPDPRHKPSPSPRPSA